MSYMLKNIVQAQFCQTVDKVFYDSTCDNASGQTDIYIIFNKSGRRYDHDFLPTVDIIF